MALSLLTPAAAAAQAQEPVPRKSEVPPASVAPAPLESELLALINGERLERRLAPLRWNPVLARLAREQAEALRAKGELSHAAPGDGAPYETRLARAGLRAKQAAENLAVDTSVSGLHAALMASEAHRANLLDPRLEEVGVGVAPDQRDGRLWAVTDFASLMPVRTDAEALTAVHVALARAWQEAGVEPPRDDAALSRRLAADLALVMRQGDPSTEGLSAPGPAQLFAYTTTDPGALPASVEEQAGAWRGCGAAVAFGPAHAAPQGIYWVALALVDPAP